MEVKCHPRVFAQICIFHYIARFLGIIPMYGYRINSKWFHLLHLIYSKAWFCSFSYLFYLIYFRLRDGIYKLSQNDEEMRFIYMAILLIEDFYLSLCVLIAYLTYFKLDYYTILDQLTQIGDAVDRLHHIE